MVGSSQGKAHFLREGEGLAEKFNTGKSLDAMYKTGAARASAAAAKQKDFNEGMDALKRPEETWHYYSQEMANRFEDWEGRAVDLMTRKGISNIFRSNDPEALKLRMEGERLKSQNSNINQYQELYGKAIDDINTRGDEYTENSVLEARYFPMTRSFDEVAGGKAEFSPLKWKAPVVSSFKKTKEIIGTLRENFSVGSDGYLSPDQIMQGAGQIVNDPQSSEGAGGGYLGQIAQGFAEMPENLQKNYQKIAARQGLNPNDSKDVLQVYLADQLTASQDSKRASVMEQAQLFANKQPLSQYSGEDKSGVTTSSTRMKGEKKAMEDAYFATLYKLPAEVEKGVQDGLFGDESNSFTENVEAGAKYWATQKPLRYEKKYGISRQNGGSSDAEKEASYNDWYERVLDSNETVAKEAMDYVFGADANGLKVTRTDVYTSPSNNSRYAILRYSNIKDRDNAVSEKLKDFNYLTPDEIEEQDDKNQFMSSMENGTTVLINLSDPANGQKFRDLYRQAAQTKKEEYSPTLEKSKFYDPRKGSSKKNPIIID